MIRKILLALSLTVFVLCAAEAKINPLMPKQNAVVSQHKKPVTDFLAKSSDERVELMKNEDFRRKLSKTARAPEPVLFVWSADSNNGFILELSENKDFKDIISVSSNGNSASVPNLKMARKYFWRVKTPDGSDVSKTRTFTTADAAPRMMTVAGVRNVRDLGGRKGLNGKRVRQNLIFRGAGLNANSKDGIKAGANTIKPEGVKYMKDVLKIKTDLDLRSKKEVADMSGSPLGKDVNWINISSSGYAGSFEKDGKERFVKMFRLFCDEKNYPFYVHCIGGADRTGSLAFILNAILGVSADELEKDWQATIFADRNMDFVAEPRYFKLVEGFDSFGSKDEPYSVKVERYLKSGGISDAEIAKFRSIMLEK